MTRLEEQRRYALRFIGRFKNGPQEFQIIGIEPREIRELRQQAIRELLAEGKIQRVGYNLRLKEGKRV